MILHLIFYVNYLGGEMPTFAINFSRPDNQIVQPGHIAKKTEKTRGTFKHC